jgi:hypothetical protein
MASPRNLGDLMMRVSRKAIVLGIAAILVALCGLAVMVERPSVAAESDTNQGVLHTSIGI